MRAAEILDLDTLVFLEPSFADLTEPIFTAEAVAIPATEARLLLSENDLPLAVAFSDGEGWWATSFLFRDPTRELLEKFEDLDGDLYQESRDTWLRAVREYFALQIRQEVTPALEDLPPYRSDLIRDLVADLFAGGAGLPCLDCCCGSGVGSAVLRSLAMQPLSYDNDPSLLSLGLATGLLLPGETMCLDGTRASRYLDPLPRGAAFMLGAIDAYSRETWEQIVEELLGLTDETLMTVGTEEEAGIVEEWCRRQSRAVEVSENDRDPIYDRWVILARKG